MFISQSITLFNSLSLRSLQNYLYAVWQQMLYSSYSL